MRREGLPLIPGYSFEDHSLKSSHHKRHIFDFKNSINVINDVSVSRSQVDPLSSEQLLEKYQAKSSRNIPEEPTKTTNLSCKVLRFFSYFKEGIMDSQIERSRIRKCVIYFFLEDDTIFVSEPKEDNSCINQGKLIKRHRIFSEEHQRYFTFEDFIPFGKLVKIYGKTFQLLGADLFTKKFYLEHLQKTPEDLGEEMLPPQDKYRKQQKTDVKKGVISLTKEDWELKRFMEYSYKGRRCQLTNEEKYLSKKFFSLDGRVLQFNCVWDDAERLYGSRRKFLLSYFLSSDEIKVSEVLEENCGRDPFPVFIKKSRIPFKGRFVHWKDLFVGAHLSVYGKAFFLYDCDPFTRRFFTGQNINLASPIDISPASPAKRVFQPPPYNGFGTEEDSLNNCKYLFVKTMKKDTKKLLKFDKIQLRFKSVLADAFTSGANDGTSSSTTISSSDPNIPPHQLLSAQIFSSSPTSSSREFVITFYCADDTVSIFEPEKRNSGIRGGKFFERKKFKKGRLDNGMSTYFKKEDFFIGNMLRLNDFEFVLLECDERTLNFMEKHYMEFEHSNIYSIFHQLKLKLGGSLEEVNQQANQMFRKGVAEEFTFEETYRLLNHHMSSKHQFMTFWRFFTHRNFESQKARFQDQSAPEATKNLPNLQVCIEYAFENAKDLKYEMGVKENLDRETHKKRNVEKKKYYQDFMRRAYKRRVFYWNKEIRTKMECHGNMINAELFKEILRKLQPHFPKVLNEGEEQYQLIVEKMFRHQSEFSDLAEFVRKLKKDSLK